MIKNASLMDRTLFFTALVLGTLSVLWTASIFVTRDGLAFAITTLIGVVFLIGVVELIQFARATGTLTTALHMAQAPIEKLEDCLEGIDASLQNAVRLRIEGARVGLPAPLLTPYLVGLLVMLGLLGTFVGMVDTLHGAVAALQGTTELQAIRQGLAAPINGLGMAFGTSVAGVATSAMLGLMSTLVRRRRVLETRRLDASGLQRFSLEHSQRETFLALQRQTQSLPTLACTLEQVALKLDRVGQGLVVGQDRFQQTVVDQYTQLARSMKQALQENLSANVHLVGESMGPIVDGVMSAMTREVRQTLKGLTQISEQTLETLGQQLISQSQTHETSWENMLAAYRQESKDLTARMGATLDDFLAQHHRQATALGNAFDTAIITWTVRQDESEKKRIAQWDRSMEDLASHTQVLGANMQTQVSRITENTAEFIQSRRETESSWIQDHTARMERLGTIMQKLDILCGSLDGNLSEQQKTIEQLVVSSKNMLETTATHLSDQVDRDMAKLTAATDAFSVSTTEMACLGDAFGKSVDLFIDANRTLIENLVSIEDALEKTSTRSDEQLGYVVAQAREIIEQSICAQREIFMELRQLNPKQNLDREAG